MRPFVVIAGLVMLAGAAAAQQSRVFVTSTTHDGNLGGLAGGDAICEERAARAGLGGGPWIAWLSTDSIDAVDRLLPGSGPFVRAGEPATVVADDIADLTDGSLDNAILLDENGSDAPFELVWTGTRPDGTSTLQGALPNAPNCGEWLSASPNDFGGSGNPMETGPGWTIQLAVECDGARTLYCMETPMPPAMPALPAWASLLLAVLVVLLGAAFVYRRAHAAG